MSQGFIDDQETLSAPLESLELEISTVNAGDAGSNDLLYVNVVFADGTRLYEPFNRLLAPKSPSPNINGPPVGPLPLAGSAKKFVLPIPPGVNRQLGEIAELFIRKEDDDGWFVGSVLLFANDNSLTPLLGNRHANQFLDNDDDVLLLREWSTSSFCIAPAASAIHALPRSGYRILGPVLGQVSDTSAVVLYRVDREGFYHLRAFDALTRAAVADTIAELAPLGDSC